jgi:hypothetical protein
MKKLLPLLSGVVLLTGCSSGAESKIADCTYYWDTANVILAKSYEWDINYQPVSAPDRAYKETMRAQLFNDWAAMVLDAPTGCFPERDEKAAREILN